MEKNTLPVESIKDALQSLTQIICVDEVLLYRDYVLCNQTLLRLRVEVNVQTLRECLTLYLCLHCKRLSHTLVCTSCNQAVYQDIPINFPASLSAECMDCKQIFIGEEIRKHTLETNHQKFLG